MDREKVKSAMGWAKGKLLFVCRKYEASGNGSTMAAEEYHLNQESQANEEPIQEKQRALYQLTDGTFEFPNTD